jgi:hypothetical protein
MMRFVLGIVVGVLGYWAYERSLLPNPLSSGGEQFGLSDNSPIVRPTPQEIAGRPSEPIPS